MIIFERFSIWRPESSEMVCNVTNHFKIVAKPKGAYSGFTCMCGFVREKETDGASLVVLEAS